MKTSHEMAQSVLEKRDRVLRRRRILTASIGAAAGTAVIAAVVVTLNVTKPRGVDLVDQRPVSQPESPVNPGENAQTSENSGDNAPQYLYNDVEIRQDGGTGSVDSYDSLVDHLEIYSGNMNFYEFTITNQFTPDKAVELTGSDIFLSGSTLFSAHISYDWLSDREEDMDILLAQAGTAESQVKNYPLYGVGETYAAFLSGFDKDSWNAACPELIFATDGTEICRHLRAEQVKFVTADGVLLGEDIPEAEQYVYTTTSNNPVRYVRKYDIVELSGFLRTDWTSRGLYSENSPLGYIDLSNAVIPDISPEERGLQAMGTRNVVLDTKRAGEYTVLLVGDHVTTDLEGHPGMISCFSFGIEIYDGKTVSEMAGAHSGAGQGDYWIYTDRFSEYTDVFQFGENYITALRYYDTDGARYTTFNAIKDGTFYTELIGDYSAVTGVKLDVTTWLSKNLSVNKEACTITDLDSGISYVFDFDAITDTFTQAHYTAVKSDVSSNEILSGRLSQIWLEEWDTITESIDFLLPQVSVFSFDLSDGSRLAAFVYPNYKSYGAAFYRISGTEITELGNEMCGTGFELLESTSGQYLHIIRKYPGSVMNENLYADDFYYRITDSSLESVLSAGTQLYDGQIVDRYVYENGESVSVTGEEYEKLLDSALPDYTSLSTVELDKDGDYKVDEYCAFEDDPDGLKAAILSVL